MSHEAQVTYPFDRVVTCPKFARADDGRCRHFLPSGCCALPEELVCRELATREVEAAKAPQQQGPAQRSLFGELAKRSTTATPPKPRAHVPIVLPKSPASDSTPAPFGLTPDDVARFKADGIEVLLDTAGGDIWLVPELTGADRQELTVEHLATVVHVASVLPGARLKGVHRRSARAAEAVR